MIQRSPYIAVATMLAASSALIAPTLAIARPAPRAASVQSRLEALEKRLEDQQSRIERQQAVIDGQQAELDRLRGSAVATVAIPPPVTAQLETQSAQIAAVQGAIDQQKLVDADRAKLTFPVGRPTITSPDGRYSIAIRALGQMDAGKYFQDAEGSAAGDYRRGSVGAAPNRETNAAKDLSDGAYFRRARLGVEGVFNRDFGYRFVAEFAGSGTEGPARINDAWISYTGLAPFTFQIGAFSPPANMDDGTSPEDTLFVERASASEMSRALGGADGRLAASARFATQRWMGALSYTSRTVNDAEVFDSQSAMVGRLGHLLFTSDDVNIHVGASGTYVFALADQGSSATGARFPVRFRDRPEVRVDSTRLIDSGSINTRRAYAAGAELAGQYKNLYLQSEYFWFGAERRPPTTLSDPRFSGYYVQGSWVITGEKRRYNMATGSFQNPRPYSTFTGSGGSGAFELAARYSVADLNFHEGAAGQAASPDAIRGGEQRIFSAGLNWYPNANLKLMLDYLHIEVDRLNPAGSGNLTPFGATPATPPVGVQIGQDADVAVVRTQFSF